MVFSRIVLGITGLAFAGYGAYCAMDLDFVVQTTGVAFRKATAAVEARAMYGGLQIGLGLLWINAAVNQRMTAYGLVAMIFVLGGLALGRALGMSLDMVDPYNTWALAYESVSAVLAGVALWLERKASSSPLFV
jgi:hypothetical protein